MPEIKVIHEYNKPSNSLQSEQNTGYYDESSKICTSKVRMIFHDVKYKNALQSENIYVPELDAKWWEICSISKSILIAF